MEIKKGGKLTVVDGVAKVQFGASSDSDGDGRAAASANVEVSIDIPELLQESMKDSATAQTIAKWLDANKSLLPPVDKEI